MSGILRVAVVLGGMVVLFSFPAKAEVQRRWYRDLNARRIAELERQLVQYQNVRFDSELYEVKRNLQTELNRRRGGATWRVQSDYSRTTFTGKHSIPHWVKRFREFGDDIEFDPPMDPEQVKANRATHAKRYEEIYAAQKKIVTTNNTSWENDWLGWVKNVETRFTEWVADTEKGLKEYAEPAVADVVRPRIETFKKQLSADLDLRKSEIKAQKGERDIFLATQMDPFYRDLLDLGLTPETFEAELVWVQGQELSYYAGKYTNPFFDWWGREAKPGIDAKWKTFDVAKVLSEEAKIFAPYKAVRDRFFETYLSWEKETVKKYIPWWPTLPAEDEAWHSESTKSLLVTLDHVRVAVEKDIAKEMDARTAAINALKKMEAVSLASRQTLLDQINNIVRKAYLGKTDPNGIQPEITRLWEDAKDGYLPDFVKMHDYWSQPFGELDRRQGFPGTEVLIDEEIKRYPLHIREKDSPYVYHVELANAETTLRYETNEVERTLLEFVGKRSFRAIGDSAILIAQQIKVRDAKVTDGLMPSAASLETDNPKGWAIRLQGEEIVEVLALPDDKLSWGEVKRVRPEKGKAADKLAVLFLDLHQTPVAEFGLLCKVLGTKKIGSVGSLESEPELWNRPRK